MAREWQKLERARKELGFLWMHEVLPEEPEEEKEVDPEQEEQERKDRDELHVLLGGTLSDLYP